MQLGDNGHVHQSHFLLEKSASYDDVNGKIQLAITRNVDHATTDKVIEIYVYETLPVDGRQLGTSFILVEQ